MLSAAVIAWATAALLSPHTPGTVAEGTEHVRTTVALFLRNSAVGTLVLSALSGWLLFPTRRPKAPRRDWAIAVVLGVLVISSVYQLIWLQAAVLD